MQEKKKKRKRQKYLPDEMRWSSSTLRRWIRLWPPFFSITLQFSGKIDFNRKNGHFWRLRDCIAPCRMNFSQVQDRIIPLYFGLLRSKALRLLACLLAWCGTLGLSRVRQTVKNDLYFSLSPLSFPEKRCFPGRMSRFDVFLSCLQFTLINFPGLVVTWFMCILSCWIRFFLHPPVFR